MHVLLCLEILRWSVSIAFTFSTVLTMRYYIISLENNITDNVAVSVDQFYTIRAVLLSSIEEEEEKEE